jgi:site-specific DNA recombinase
MRGAVYARYSSENQRPESIADQVSACRRFADQHGHTVLDDHIYADAALSGARKDRPNLKALTEAASGGAFDIVLVDDLSRLARDNYLMLTVMAELEFEGVRVISVADGIDSGDEDATLGIQIRGIFNQLQLQDLKKKTLRGQIGQKERGFFVGEKTYGYRSVAVGEMKMDKKGRPRPEGYQMEIEPTQAALVLRIFKEFVDGNSQTAIVKALNEEGVPGSFRRGGKWSPSTVHRMLTNEKYIGRWVWNRKGTRRDPRTGKQRTYEKPESDWIIHEDDSLRIVPEDLWKEVRGRKEATRKTWPGGKGQRGFSGQQGSKERHYPTHLFSGSMICDSCGGGITQISGKSGGYYGCLRASKGGCENKLLVPRKRAEKIIVGAISERLQDADHLRYVLEQVEKEIAKLRSTVPETAKLKEAELVAQRRKLDNFIEAIGEGRDSKALGKALADTERRVDGLQEEVQSLHESRERVFKVPPAEWVKERLVALQEVLEGQTEKSALLLREILGTIRLEPVTNEAAKPFYRAKTALDAIALIEAPLPRSTEEGGSNALQQWRRRDSNSDPRTRCEGVYRFSRRLILVSRGPRRRALREIEPLWCSRAVGAIRPGEPAF